MGSTEAMVPDQKQIDAIFAALPKDEFFKAVADFRRMMTYYTCAMMEIETKFRVLNQEFSMRYDRNPISGIHTRLKSVRSIAEKMTRRGVGPNLSDIQEQIHDIAGVRVICAFEDDVYYLEKALLAQDDITLLQRKDYIDQPKANGYRSLHLIVTVPIFLTNEKRLMQVEIQLRTIAMDAWANLEHQLRYKKDTSESDADAKLLHCARLVQEFDVWMNELQEERFGNELE